MIFALKKPIFIIVLLSFLVSVTIALVASSATVLAQDAETACQGIEAAGGNCGGGDAEVKNVIQGVIEVLLYIVGVAAVIALIIGGIRYAVSGGDQQAIASAKNTVIYSIVGLIVAVLAYALVNYVFGELGGAEGSGNSPGAGGRAL